MLSSELLELARTRIRIEFDGRREGFSRELQEIQNALSLQGLGKSGAMQEETRQALMRELDIRALLAWQALSRILSSQSPAIDVDLNHQLKDEVASHLAAGCDDLITIHRFACENLPGGVLPSFEAIRERALANISSEIDFALLAVQRGQEAVGTQTTINIHGTLNKKLDLARQWGQVRENIKQQQTAVFNLLAPTRPLTALNEVKARFEAAFRQFQVKPTAELAIQVQELGQQLLQLARQTPGFDLPSKAFQNLVAEVQYALETITRVAHTQPSEMAIHRQITDLKQQQVETLASIDKRIQESSQAGQAQNQQRQRFDVFISHASEDKDAIARPLYQELNTQGVTVWFDEAVLELGDSLRQKIDEGLAKCRYGVVILSPHFFRKQWPQKELDGLVARETASGEKAVLPVWHEIDRDGVLAYSPTMADRVAARSAEGVAVVAAKILAVLKK